MNVPGSTRTAAVARLFSEQAASCLIVYVECKPSISDRG